MKRLTKTFLMLCLAFLCSFSVPASVYAASSTPAQVKSLKAKAGESSVTLSWKKVSNATGYYIYLQDPDTKALKKVASTKTTSCTVKKLTNNTSYTFRVCAYRTTKSKTYTGKVSAEVTVTPMVKKPAVTKLVVKSCSDQRVSLKWNKVSGATGYELFQKDPSTGKYKSIGTLSSKTSSVTVKKLTNGTNYQFKIRAFRKVSGITRYGNFSSAVTAKPIVVSTAVQNVHSAYYSATVNKTVRVSTTASPSKKITVSSGIKVTVTSYSSSSSCTAKLKNGTEFKISSSYITRTSQIIGSKDYSTSVKENYVNSKGYSSSTPYLIWVSLYNQKMYIFKGSQCNWKLYKTFVCSTGLLPNITPPGIYQIHKKSIPFWFDKYSYARYASYFSGNAIHSWVYVVNENGPDFWSSGTLGKPASHGCVRLAEKNAKFVYDRMPFGTRVVIY